jgi:glycerophosphoryl diester phosphodiesterase
MKPLVIAHRGACGYRPEHTLAAYTLAIEQGADFIEPDLVPTRDGVLIARHENDLSDSTDVADRPVFADRRCAKMIDGVEHVGWFSEDFTLDEIKTLRARERLPQLRPDNAGYDGLFEVPSFAEILALLHEAERGGRRVGVYPETKHPTFFMHEGRHPDGRPIAQSLPQMVVAGLVAAGFTEPDRVFLQSFEIESLLELKQRWMPAAGVDFPLVQLIGNPRRGRPRDLAWHLAQGHELTAVYGDLGACWSDGLGEHVRYGHLLQPAALRWLRGQGIAVLGPSFEALLPDGPDGPVTELATDARAAGLALHPYTLRAELGGEAYGRRLLTLGVQAFFIDQPDLGVALRDG